MVKGEKEVEEFKKRDYVNFKQVVWHDLFYKFWTQFRLTHK